MTTRPWLLLDVDGVLCLLGAGCREPQREVQLGWQPVRFSVALPERLERLSRTFRLAWATSWGHEANHLLAPELGLPQLPVVAFGDDDGGPDADYKLPGIIRFAGDAPLAWVDDVIADSSFAWARRRPSPTLLIETHPGRGLGNAETEELLGWAAEL